MAIIGDGYILSSRQARSPKEEPGRTLGALAPTP